MTEHSELIGEDEVVEKDCKACSSTDHLDLGYVPAQFAGEAPDDNYIRAFVCLSCGGIIVNTPNQEELEETRQRYLRVLVEQEVIDKEEAEEAMPSLDLN